MNSGLSQATVAGFRWAAWCLTMCVWLFPAALYCYAATATAVVGHWPSYGHPDPKQLGMPLFHGGVMLAFYVSLLAALALVVSEPIFALALGWRSSLFRIAIGVLGVAVAFSCFYPDPAGVGEWYAD